MKITDLAPDQHNPRFASQAKLTQLKKAMLKFGDLSGIIYNRRLKRMVGGHQRKQIFGGDEIVTVTKKFSKPTKTGTVAEGYVELNGEKFSYREVYWDETLHKAATIAANKNAGEWNIPLLNQTLKELSDFDLDFDLDLTMFDAKELAELPTPIEVSGHTRTPGNGKDDEKEKPKGPAKCKPGQVYALGEARLKVGGDLHFCDRVISLWEKHSGDDATLMPKTTVKPPSKLSNVRTSGHA
jgi:hypothetical protein